MSLAQLYAENGFTSFAAMDASHQVIIDYAAAHVIAPVTSLLDLGCGNGLLLKKLQAVYPGAALSGVDSDPERIATARILCAGDATGFEVGSLYEAAALCPAQRYDLTILMAGRLSLGAVAERRALLRFLSTRSRQTLVYLYPDWTQRGEDVREICQSFGLKLLPDAQAHIGMTFHSEFMDQQGRA